MPLCSRNRHKKAESEVGTIAEGERATDRFVECDGESIARTIAAIAAAPLGNDFARDKLALAQFYALHVLALAPAQLAPIEAGASSMEHFAGIS